MTFEEWWKTQKVIKYNLKIYAKKGWDAAKEEFRPRWIPVSERLPCKDAVYPALIENWDCWVTRRFEKEAWWKNSEGEKVTHWMEIPE